MSAKDRRIMTPRFLVGLVDSNHTFTSIDNVLPVKLVSVTLDELSFS